MAIIVIVLLMITAGLACPSSSAFVAHHHHSRAHIQRFHLHTQLPRTLLNRRITRDDERKSIIHFAKNNNKNDDVEKTQYTSTVEDGSPIGVAIVLIGSLLIFGGDESLQAPSSSSVWIVFATASIAAGLARLIRYTTSNKNK
ncbi:hypothetical protein ACHAXR_003711 [Thalassiosira sp. AJA248-18]